jgi:PAS domain S-box-containing protein
MRDQHRPKQDLINEVVALRKQVDDLRDAMAARRRVEDALRHSEEQLRALIDGSPVGLCLVRPDGSAVAANRPFARMLGYDSPAELLSVGDVVGVFASREEQSRMVDLVTGAEDCSGSVLFRRKNGGPLASWVLGALCRNPDAIALVVVEEVSAASSAGRRSA